MRTPVTFAAVLFLLSAVAPAPGAARGEVQVCRIAVLDLVELIHEVRNLVSTHGLSVDDQISRENILWSSYGYAIAEVRSAATNGSHAAVCLRKFDIVMRRQADLNGLSAAYDAGSLGLPHAGLPAEFDAESIAGKIDAFRSPPSAAETGNAEEVAWRLLGSWELAEASMEIGGEVVSLIVEDFGGYNWTFGFTGHLSEATGPIAAVVGGEQIKSTWTYEPESGRLVLAGETIQLVIKVEFDALYVTQTNEGLAAIVRMVLLPSAP